MQSCENSQIQFSVSNREYETLMPFQRVKRGWADFPLFCGLSRCPASASASCASCSRIISACHSFARAITLAIVLPLKENGGCLPLDFLCFLISASTKSQMSPSSSLPVSKLSLLAIKSRKPVTMGLSQSSANLFPWGLIPRRSAAAKKGKTC